MGGRVPPPIPLQFKYWCPPYMLDVFVDGYLNEPKTVHDNINYLHSNSEASKLLKFIISKRVLNDC